MYIGGPKYLTLVSIDIQTIDIHSDRQLTYKYLTKLLRTKKISLTHSCKNEIIPVISHDCSNVRTVRLGPGNREMRIPVTGEEKLHDFTYDAANVRRI